MSDIRRKRHKTTATGYFKAAVGHLRAAQILGQSLGPVGSSGTGDLFLPLYNVLGFSVELYLKTFLVLRGMTADDLSSPAYGHRLDKLLSAGYELGLEEALPPFLHRSALDKIVEILAPQHGDFSFRYMPEDGEHEYIYFQDINIVVGTLAALDETLRAMLSASSQIATAGQNTPETREGTS